ncbi:YebC/PmpR family DNA-binding transcriptional regulator [Calderihabitans maritimus]|uniref:Probable transcriptional regulatory protein KKC1_18750 n=1 Tax=Calderihabitans maritimus TaxID=1246530 RepID=A0A1Z5HTT4_9FIRM|nr:YebC/PmpR family DNA-binding transcriptional regulator [Calderihabitans maritimus]GAW92725.1 hypothetical protein Slip_0739 [Calderihabitans maritimus]
MAGHSKWANIKHKKARMDAKRGKLFTKLGREIIVAAKLGGGDPEANPRLKAAIQKAREANMPNDNIIRAIKRGTGEIEGADYEEVVYEGYGPGGVALLLKATTDNRNRTASEIRHLFAKNGGNLGENGCVAWMFDMRGLLTVDLNEVQQDPEEIMLESIEAGAEDVSVEGETVEIITAPDELMTVKETLAEKGYKFTIAEVTMIPKTTVSVSDREQAEKILKLVDVLEDHDDVQSVYANFDIPDDLMKEIGQ